ncbi:MAG: transcription-repair coupling factor, partial [Muribaculaceae bacterium]|nr:transcription-repair coupling factor [Muribaculaceae bacterium]
MIVIGSDPDDAGYLYHDLARLAGEDAVVYFPSGYKRDIRYGQPDAPSVILRTEALRRLGGGDPTLRFVVTCPEALAEQVASRSEIAADTVSLTVGTTVDPVELQDKLLGLGFKEVDYVYEPGHFAVRGSIVDVYGYGAELPFRIDFFGDEIDSIRAFNIETQLSETRLQHIDIVADIETRSTGGESLLKFIDPSTLIASRMPDRTCERIAEIASGKLSENAVTAGDIDTEAMSRVV